MKLTNVHQIPEWIVKRLVPYKAKPLDPKRLSTTWIIKPPRMRTLYIERFNDLISDVSEYFAMWYGNLLDSAFDDEEMAQNKMEWKVDDVTLVGKWDLFDEGIIHDNKFCKVGQLHYGETLKEWEAQLNIYSFLWNQLNFERVKGLQNNLFYKDWSPTKVGRENSYPKIAYEVFKQPHWTEEDQHKYILERLEYHKEQPYDCPEEERWGSFAVKTKGKQRADRVLKTRAECEEWMNTNGRGDYIESREGLRCQFFCPVKSVCKYSPCCQSKFKGEK